MKFYFFIKKDPKKEPISVTDANDVNEAISKFSIMKKLPIKKFLSIFSVIKKN